MVLWPFDINYFLLVASPEFCLGICFLLTPSFCGTVSSIQTPWMRPQPNPTRSSRLPRHTDGISVTQARHSSDTLLLSASSQSQEEVFSILSWIPTWKDEKLKLLQRSCYSQLEAVCDWSQAEDLGPRRCRGSGPRVIVGSCTASTASRTSHFPEALTSSPHLYFPFVFS